MGLRPAGTEIRPDGAPAQVDAANRPVHVANCDHARDSVHSTVCLQERPMDEQQGQPSRSRRPSGRDAKRAARTARSHTIIPYITRKIPYYEVLSAEGLELLENNAETIL